METVKTCITLPSTIYNKLRKYAFDRDLSRSEVVRLILTLALEGPRTGGVNGQNKKRKRTD